jgi:hypothetical protein
LVTKQKPCLVGDGGGEHGDSRHLETLIHLSYKLYQLKYSGDNLVIGAVLIHFFPKFFHFSPSAFASDFINLHQLIRKRFRSD